MAELSIEQDYNRFIPPQVDEVLEEMTENEWEDDGETQFLENEDGSITIVDPVEETPKSDFYDNLAETLTSSELSRLATEYLEFIDRDKEARSKRDAQYEEGIRRTGLGDDAPGGAGFEGASRVVHPVLAEGCVDFAARAIKELCPPNGPVKTQILGKVTGKKLQRATRKRNFLNWQLTKQSPEFFTELEQMLSQLPLGGSQYIKVLPNQQAKRPEFEFIPIDKLLVPFAASNFYTAQRVTHIQEITEQTFTDRISTGYYRDVDIFQADEPAETKSETASNKVEGKDRTPYNEDGLRTVYEITCYAKLKFDQLTGGELAPYVIVVDDSLATVLAIYRNWKESDENQTKLDWIVEFKFIPWRGAQAIGLPHLIGGLAAALTGSLRALLDSAHVNNAPTALKLKGARLSGQTQQVEVTQIQEIDGVAGTDDIRKLIMPMPFNQPSAVLFQLLDWLTNASKGVVATAEEKISDASNQMPVGTALALIEQGSINYSAIHMRLHNSMAKLLEVICRINFELLDEEVVIEALGEEVVYRDDFRGSTDVIPVSDPNIFSESQRYAQIQAVMQLAEVGVNQGVKYNVNEIHRRALELMKVNDIDDILPEVHKPSEMNAVAENVTVMLGNGIIVFPEQDHFSHIESHLRFITDPNFGGNILVAAKTIPAMLEHVSQHLAFLYAQACNSATSAVMPGGPNMVTADKLDALLAAVTAKVAATSTNLLQPILSMIAQAQQIMQQSMPQPPMDPSVQVQREIGMAEINRQTQRDQMEDARKKEEAASKAQADNAAIMQKANEKVADLQLDAERLKKEAAEMLHRAATEAEKNELERQRRQNEFELNVAKFEQEKLEFEQKRFDEEQRRLAEMITAEAPVQETKEDSRLDALIQSQQDIIKAVQQLQQKQTEPETNGLVEALNALAVAMSAPKMIIKDERGRPIGVAASLAAQVNT